MGRHGSACFVPWLGPTFRGGISGCFGWAPGSSRRLRRSGPSCRISAAASAGPRWRTTPPRNSIAIPAPLNRRTVKINAYIIIYYFLIFRKPNGVKDWLSLIKRVKPFYDLLSANFQPYSSYPSVWLHRKLGKSKKKKKKTQIAKLCVDCHIYKYIYSQHIIHGGSKLIKLGRYDFYDSMHYNSVSPAHVMTCIVFIIKVR